MSGLVLQTKTVYSGGWKSFLGQDCNGCNEIGDPDNAVRDVDDDSLDDAYVNYDSDGDDDDDDEDDGDDVLANHLEVSKTRMS